MTDGSVALIVGVRDHCADAGRRLALAKEGEAGRALGPRSHAQGCLTISARLHDEVL